jgi:hypothetical protein
MSDEPELWLTLAWNGLPLLRCRQCAWDTLDGEAAMLEHLARHGARVEVAPVEAPRKQRLRGARGLRGGDGRWHARV